VDDHEESVLGPQGSATRRPGHKTFIRRIRARASGGSYGPATTSTPAGTDALNYAVAEANTFVARPLARYAPPGIQALRDAVVHELGMPVEWRDPL
jgi:hypothetical protein